MVVRNPKLNLSVTATGGHYLPIALGQIELKDVGKENGGVTFADAINIILSLVTSNVENAVLGAGDIVGSHLPSFIVEYPARFAFRLLL